VRLPFPERTTDKRIREMIFVPANFCISKYTFLLKFTFLRRYETMVVNVVPEIHRNANKSDTAPQTANITPIIFLRGGTKFHANTFGRLPFRIIERKFISKVRIFYQILRYHRYRSSGVTRNTSPKLFIFGRL